jgi:hypothetical protein
MPVGGGLSLSAAGKTILVVTPQAPLGRALVGKSIGDECIANKTYEIQEIS